MMENLVPAIIPKPVSFLTVRVDCGDPWCAKCAYSHCGIYHSFLISRLNRPLHDVLKVLGREHVLQGPDDSFRRRNIDAFAPIA